MDPQTAALETMISSGEFAEIESTELQRSLNEWLASSVFDRQRIGARYTRAHDETVDYLTEVMPYEHVVSQAFRPSMPPSGFPLDVRAVLSSPRIESLFGNVGIMKSFVCNREATDRQIVKELLEMLAGELGKGAT